MNLFRQIFPLLFLYIVVVLGWFIARLDHRSTKFDSPDAVSMPHAFTFIVGPPGSDRVYNVRGLYLQVLVMTMAIFFTLYNLHFITKVNAIRNIISITILVVLGSEIMRFIIRKKKS